MKVDLANLVGGGGVLKAGAVALYLENGLSLNAGPSTFNLNVDGYEKVDERTEDSPLELSGTPMTAWGRHSLLYPYINWPLGSYITPVIRFRAANVDAEEDTLALSGKFLFGLATGEKVYIGTRGTLLGGVTRDTVYYAKVASGQVVTLHPTQADAVAGTNAVDLTTAGSGQHSLVIERSIVFHTFEGKKITFFNAPITKTGDLTLSAVKTQFGEFTWRAFPRNRTELTDAASRFLIEDVPFDDASFNPADILTQAYSMKWGNTAPWAEMFTEEGIKVAFDHTMTERKIDGLGVPTMKLSGLGVTVSATPLGIDEEDVFAKLRIQGAGAGIGRSLAASGADLDILGAGVFLRIYGAALKGAPLRFNQRDDRAGELQWIATRSFPAGVAQPLALFGTEAPA